MKAEELLSKVHAEITDYPKMALSVELQNAIQKFYNPNDETWTCECGFTQSTAYKTCQWCGFREGHCKCGLGLLNDNSCPHHG